MVPSRLTNKMMRQFEENVLDMNTTISVSWPVVLLHCMEVVRQFPKQQSQSPWIAPMQVDRVATAAARL